MNVMALKRSSIMHISGVENHLYVQPTRVSLHLTFCIYQRLMANCVLSLTLANVRLVPTVSSPTTKSFQEGRSVLTERGDFGLRGPWR
jgi:hypothetical protein